MAFGGSSSSSYWPDARGILIPNSRFVFKDGTWIQDPNEPNRLGWRLLGTGWGYSEKRTDSAGNTVYLYRVNAIYFDQDDTPDVTQFGNGQGRAATEDPYRIQKNPTVEVVSTSDGGHIATYRDRNNKPTESKVYNSDDKQVGYGKYDDDGRLTDMHFANGDSYNATYNDNGTLSQEVIWDSGQMTVVDYDENGNQTDSNTYGGSP